MMVCAGHDFRWDGAVVKETFQLHPVAGLLPYESTEDAVTDGHHIPPKSHVFVNNYAISRSPENFIHLKKYAITKYK